MSSPPDDSSGNTEEVEGKAEQSGREQELRRLAPRLISLEVWCRERELNEIAHHLSAAVDELDRELTQPLR